MYCWLAQQITLDLFQSYQQVDLSESGNRINYVTPHMSSSQWEYNCMPFSIQGGPVTYQRLMDNLLHDLEYKIAPAYLDDAIVFGKVIRQTLYRSRTSVQP